MNDKVFFNQHTAQFNYDKHSSDDIVYLRKDALLEWAKEVKANPMIPMNIDKVIEKIESL